MEKYCYVNNGRNALQTGFGNPKTEKKFLCGILKKKRTKIGFASEVVTTSRLRSENQLTKHKSSMSIGYNISDSVLNSKDAAEIKQYISSTEITNNKNQALLYDLVKLSHSSIALKNSGDGFDVNVQVLCLNEKENSDCKSNTSAIPLEGFRDITLKEKPFSAYILHSENPVFSRSCENNEEKYFSTTFFSSCAQSDISDNSSSSEIFFEPCSKKCIVTGKRSLKKQKISKISDKLSSSKSLPNIFRSNVSSFYCETATQFKGSRNTNFIPTGSKRKNCMRKIVSPIFSLPVDISTKKSLSCVKTHLVPAIEARKRNFLYGRTATNSLLGSLELERTLPHRELRIFVGTWNMNGQIPRELNDFLLPPSLEHVSDMIVVGTQESYSEHFEWEVRMQETLGPSHLLFHSTFLGTLHLAVFMRRDLLWFCSVPEDASFCVRTASTFKTKGAVAIGFVIFGSSYLFITSHLTAHMENVQKRIKDVRRITRSLDLPKIPVRHKSKDVTQNYDYVFWCGDLNFRLSQSREEILQWVAKQKFPLSSPYSLNSDQLKHTILNGIVFRGFQEGPITFPPTYKYDLGSQDFDTSYKQRIPAYTDRILYKRKGRGVLKCLDYTSVQNMCSSDHKPVWGLFSSKVRPGIDTIPLAAGLFNREVYLQGIKRRASGMPCSENTSSICSIQ